MQKVLVVCPDGYHPPPALSQVHAPLGPPFSSVQYALGRSEVGLVLAIRTERTPSRSVEARCGLSELVTDCSDLGRLRPDPGPARSTHPYPTPDTKLQAPGPASAPSLQRSPPAVLRSQFEMARRALLRRNWHRQYGWELEPAARSLWSPLAARAQAGATTPRRRLGGVAGAGVGCATKRPGAPKVEKKRVLLDVWLFFVVAWLVTLLRRVAYEAMRCGPRYTLGVREAALAGAETHSSGGMAQLCSGIGATLILN